MAVGLSPTWIAFFSWSSDRIQILHNIHFVMGWHVSGSIISLRNQKIICMRSWWSESHESKRWKIHAPDLADLITWWSIKLFLLNIEDQSFLMSAIWSGYLIWASSSKLGKPCLKPFFGFQPFKWYWNGAHVYCSADKKFWKIWPFLIDR